ncbi:MAG: peptidoglycan DD-metalloendopeptidase family protein [Ignavibacteriae bacterium]|nr:peptidoglycan DD-metalloendopeptidase family protein [Ignavibacteriota bacterium]
MGKKLFILFLCSFIAFYNFGDFNTAYAKQKSKKSSVLKKKKNNTTGHKKVNTKKTNSKNKINRLSSNKNQYFNEKGDLKQHQKDLDKLTKSISETKQKLNNLQTKEKTEVSKLNQHKHKSTILKKDINTLTKKIDEFQDTIGVLRYQKETLKNKLGRLRREYASLLKEYYLNINSNSNLLATLLATPLPEIQKEVYMRHLTGNMAELAHEILNTSDSISRKEDVYLDKTNEQFVIKNKKEFENKVVQKTIAGQEVKIGQIRKDKNLLAKQLSDMQNSARKLKGIVNQLIQNEIAKEKKKNESITSKTTTKETKLKSENKTSNEKYVSIVIPSETKRTSIGRLVWPTNSRSISKYYGANKNPETNTVFDNPGVDISANVGSPVIASADGVVSLIHWLPGYGTLIIINHGGGIRTVYANLSTVNVRKDQSVKQGTVIGRTGETVDGASLHFELWQGSTRLNPLSYIR